ncbi:hypothetical protein SE17_00425 [Kouleothrix aurantiaca]|uniref:Putative endonuclease Z1 domain-containing protein n=1 Tax=Kouleothrix aurantiaca TaxID=186479 RepID=A0A0P9FDX1_9CHLR|nr:hypothetical protein SE17_00425 [Kouleothrix aurantiaca]
MSATPNSLNAKPETVRVISTPSGTLETWSPSAGKETIDLLNELKLPDQESRDRLLEEALAILQRCVAPDVASGSKTGLAVGYVQSGKTMSFTIVTALARDNGYPIVIVIGGISIPLFTQSEERLEKDLRLKVRPDRKWKYLSNPGIAQRQSIESSLAEWKDPTVPFSEKQTVLITVMKNHTHLNNLNKLLEKLNLNQVPVLVIDDEADQAGLNAGVNKGQQTTTYRRLIKMRSLLKNHSFLQYTATPQAPLLINLIDVLSPNFTQVLTPGKDYTGGKNFFGGNMELVRIIPTSDIPPRNGSLPEPPQSLQYAMMLFYLGVASAYAQGELKGNRSMMVHPSQKTLPHAEYVNWVRKTQKLFLDTLQLSPGDPDRADLVADFSEAYKDLQATVVDLPDFDTLLKKLARAIRATLITEVNSKHKDGTPQVKWKNDYSHILVGGQAMDRGFTVEGLTITYMPRGLGTRTADTIQQRARFFGYKQDYVGYCRVFVENDTRDAFRAYVTHEEDIRSRLTDHSNTNKPLSEWKRAFFLDPGLKPTRKSVLDLAYLQDDYSDDWFEPDSPHDNPEAVVSNRVVVKEFLAKLTLVDDEGHKDRTPIQRHKVVRNVPLKETMEQLLAQLRVTRLSDSQRFTGIMLQIERFLDDNPEATSTIYHISGGIERERAVDAQGKIPTLFQGPHPDKKGAIYPGDRNIRDVRELTIQIHNLRIKEGDDEYPGVPAIAVWVPAAMSNPWLSQNQGGTNKV